VGFALHALYFQEIATYKMAQCHESCQISLQGGLLKLQEGGESFCTQDLQEMIVYLGKNSRPDANRFEERYLIGVKGAREVIFVQPQQKVYLRYEEGLIKFSQEPQPLWICFAGVEGDFLGYSAAVVVAKGDDQGVYQEKAEGVLPLTQPAHQLSWGERDFCATFEQSKWWRPDLLYEAYGGEEFAALKGCHRLEFFTEEGVQAGLCFVKPHTRLLFKEGCWVSCLEQEKTEQYPLAEIVAITSSHMEITLWDESGIYCRDISLVPERSEMARKVEDVFSHIKQRSSHMVSCKVGARQLLLREGDWILHTGLQWKVLKSYEDIEKYLSQQLQGELFVFEEIETGQGNTVFKGRLFDTMRQHMQVVRIPMVSTKKQVVKRKPKHEPSAIPEQASSVEGSRQGDELLKPATRRS